MTTTTRRRPPAALLTLVLAAAVGPFLDDYLLYVFSLVGVYVIFALGYNLLMGYAGQFDFGQGAFLGIGAYSTAMLQVHLGLPFVIALPLGGVVAVVFGLAIGAIVLRLSGFYLALVTLGFHQTVVLGIALWTQGTGGFQGMTVPRPSIPGMGDNLLMFYIVAAIAVLLVQAAVNILRSRIGGALVAIRDSDIAAQSMGIDLTRTKILAYAISAFYGGIAGGLLAMLLSYITPEGFGLVETLKVLTMIVVGGMGSVAGSVIGAVVMTLSTEMLRLPMVSVEITNGVLLMLFIMLMPTGIYGVFNKLRDRFGRKRVGAAIPVSAK